MDRLQVKNRAPNPIQISAEHLLRDARERHLDAIPSAPTQYIADEEELALYQRTKRKDFESQIQRNRSSLGLWLRYANWEADQKEFERSRSVFERAIDNDYKIPALWIKYTEMELKNKFINHARNIFDRAVTLLPRIDQLWLKYSYMEEISGAIDQAMQVFERWMSWEPDEAAWIAYIKFYIRHNEVDRARSIYERYITIHATPNAFLKYAKWEEKIGQIQFARIIYEKALQVLGTSSSSTTTTNDNNNNNTVTNMDLVLAFARFEEKCEELDRARVIYKFAIDQQQLQQQQEQEEERIGTGSGSKRKRLNDVFALDDVNGNRNKLKREYLAFEKRHGSTAHIEHAILETRRGVYQQAIEKDQYDYDAWFDLCRLEERAFDEISSSSSSSSTAIQNALNRVRTVYEAAIAQVPLVNEKRYWKRYIYLWVFYVVWEELTSNAKTTANDYSHTNKNNNNVNVTSTDENSVERVRGIYQRCLGVIPHKKFTFGKIWVMAAHFEVRQKDMFAARKLLGRCIGMCGKPCVFRAYIELELQLGEVDRCRAIYTKYLELMPESNVAWLSYIKLETDIGEVERARALYHLAVEQPALEMPENIWKSYIDFEKGLCEYKKVRSLYEMLLNQSKHVRVFLSYATFEMEIPSIDHDGENDKDENDNSVASTSGIERARRVYRRAEAYFKDTNSRPDRVEVLEHWVNAERLALEQQLIGASREDVSAVEAKLPRKIKVRRPMVDEDGHSAADGRMEEFYEYSFPEDVKQVPGLKILENAMKWKQKLQAIKAQSTSDGANVGGAADDTSIGNINSNGDRDAGIGETEGYDSQKNEPDIAHANTTTNAVEDSNEIDIDI